MLHAGPLTRLPIGTCFLTSAGVSRESLLWEQCLERLGVFISLGSSPGPPPPLQGSLWSPPFNSVTEEAHGPKSHIRPELVIETVRYCKLVCRPMTSGVRETVFGVRVAILPRRYRPSTSSRPFNPTSRAPLMVPLSLMAVEHRWTNSS